MLLGIAKKIIQARPQLAREEDVHNETPVHLAVLRGHVDVLRVLLEHDQTLGYLVCSDGTPLLNIAALRGYVSAAREILDHCPDTPYGKQNGSTCLHVAVQSDEMEFVNFVLTSQQLRKLVNMRDQNGMTALHHSVRKCMPKMLAALLRHPDIDVTVLTNKGSPATWLFDDAIKSAKSLQWVRYPDLFWKTYIYIWFSLRCSKITQPLYISLLIYIYIYIYIANLCDDQ
jgi:ankyrin repeat protein